MIPPIAFVAGLVLPTLELSPDNGSDHTRYMPVVLLVDGVVFPASIPQVPPLSDPIWIDYPEIALAMMAEREAAILFNASVFEMIQAGLISLNQPPANPLDVNRDGAVNSQDLFDWISMTGGL